jgi:predicted phosphodiesterase
LPERRRAFPKKFSKNTEWTKAETWVQLVSDLHDGLVVVPGDVGGLSEYNPKITRERMEYLAFTIGKIIQYHTNRPTTLIVPTLGDLIENAIMRGNQRANIAYDLTMQIIDATEIMTDFLLALCRYFPIVKVFGVYGNHGRSTQSPTNSPPKENFDRLIYWMLQQRLQGNKDLTIEYTDADHMIVEIEDWNFWLEHGDSVRGWMGFPYYGSIREKGSIGATLQIVREQADYLVMGHTHHALTDIDSGLIVNGSVVGGDLYSVGKLRTMNIPHQVLFGVNQKHGVVWERPIALIDDPRQDIKIEIHH